MNKMMNNNQPTKKPSPFTRKYLALLTVCIITGFIIGFSYNLSKDKRTLSTASHYYEQENHYREELIVQQERNKELSDELVELEEKIRTYEKEYSSNEVQYERNIKEAEQLRLLLGIQSGEGKGIKVTLQDAEYNPGSTNPNEYIVHESHIFKVLNELKIAGAEAIAINGQRLKMNSYISCNGPVITIDGNQYPAPFVIEAVGKQEVLISSLELTGGVFDQLLNERVVVTLEKSDLIQMQSINEEG
ncbi:hypothetical protein CSE16_03950 [Solibacillus sp. R5-41]|uniref:DUF881 domain-containing protein n=1 Tax=Solibacillus sp. R5-41 TaxID=2048654 RepID=UPI000C1283FD|nr:DUF881 domain-containing protein [Solibacillus sp. R5-41]ATP39257.1 hypothetical protein CSE16_03950 [Solibacillus sp. R5-41]